MKGGVYGWYDAVGTSGGTCKKPGRHDIFSSTTISENQTAFRNACDKIWLFGSELRVNLVKINPQIGIPSRLHTIDSLGSLNEMHVYGGNLRALNETTEPNMITHIVSANDGARVHVHGTGIDAENTNSNGASVTALLATNNASIHANGAAYSLNAGAGGSITRISTENGGKVAAPYLWQVGAVPPTITSQTGADISVITSTPDSQPHLLIYSNNCTSMWYDTNTNGCY